MPGASERPAGCGRRARVIAVSVGGRWWEVRSAGSCERAQDLLALVGNNDPVLGHLVWKRREIENCLCTEATLEACARASATAAMPMPLFTTSEVDRRLAAGEKTMALLGERRSAVISAAVSGQIDAECTA